MLSLLLRGGLLITLNLFIGFIALLWLGRPASFEPWETDAVFEGNALDETYDIAILGTSRAHALSRFEANHTFLEDSLDANVLNLALPAAGGVKPAWSLLRYALDQGVQPRVLLLCLDPFVFFSEDCNETHKFVYTEPFNLAFLRVLMEDRHAWRRILIYVRHKFSLDWMLRQPAYLSRIDDQLASLPSTESVTLRMKSLYTEGLPAERLQRYGSYLEKILTRCEAEGITVHIFLMPTLLGPEPGQFAFDAFLKELATRHPFAYHNETNALRDPALFYDSDHLNTKGVETVVRKLLKPRIGAA